MFEIVLFLAVFAAGLFLFVLEPDKGAALVAYIKSFFKSGGAAMLAVMLMAGAVQAQQPCMPYSDFVKQAKAQFDEVPFVEFETENGKIVIMASPVKHTVTVVIIRGGTACLIAGGENIRAAKVPLPPLAPAKDI